MFGANSNPFAMLFQNFGMQPAPPQVVDWTGASHNTLQDALNHRDAFITSLFQNPDPSQAYAQASNMVGQGFQNFFSDPRQGNVSNLFGQFGMQAPQGMQQFLDQRLAPQAPQPMYQPQQPMYQAPQAMPQPGPMPSGQGSSDQWIRQPGSHISVMVPWYNTRTGETTERTAGLTPPPGSGWVEAGSASGSPARPPAASAPQPMYQPQQPMYQAPQQIGVNTFTGRPGVLPQQQPEQTMYQPPQPMYQPGPMPSGQGSSDQWIRQPGRHISVMVPWYNTRTGETTERTAGLTPPPGSGWVEAGSASGSPARPPAASAPQPMRQPQQQSPQSLTPQEEQVFRDYIQGASPDERHQWANSWRGATEWAAADTAAANREKSIMDSMAADMQGGMSYVDAFNKAMQAAGPKPRQTAPLYNTTSPGNMPTYSDEQLRSLFAASQQSQRQPPPKVSKTDYLRDLGLIRVAPNGAITETYAPNRQQPPASSRSPGMPTPGMAQPVQQPSFGTPYAPWSQSQNAPQQQPNWGQPASQPAALQPLRAAPGSSGAGWKESQGSRIYDPMTDPRGTGTPGTMGPNHVAPGRVRNPITGAIQYDAFTDPIATGGKQYERTWRAPHVGEKGPKTQPAFALPAPSRALDIRAAYEPAGRSSINQGRVVGFGR